MGGYWGIEGLSSNERFALGPTGSRKPMQAPIKINPLITSHPPISFRVFSFNPPKTPTSPIHPPISLQVFSFSIGHFGWGLPAPLLRVRVFHHEGTENTEVLRPSLRAKRSNPVF